MVTTTKKKERKVEYNNFRSILLSELERIEDEEDCDIHKAFVYETARVFSSTASGIAITDGKNDWGIDFCRADPPIFVMAQCKCPERERLMESEKPLTYDRKALEDMLTGIKYILDIKNTYTNVSLDLKQFKNTYHASLKEWKKETRLQVSLAIFGELKPQARNYFNNQKNELVSSGVELLLWDWRKYDELLTTPNIEVDNMKLAFIIEDPEKELLRRKSPICLIGGNYLVEAWEQYQWNLVDWNVRAEIKHSPTNKKIQNTLLTPAGRRLFQEYNNGLLVVCKQVTYKNLPDKKISITLHQPQVVNGCQTLLSIVRAYLDLSEKDKEDFKKNVQVQLKIIANQKPEYVEKIIQSTNDQNPMSARSLKSNAIEQIKLQEMFSKFFIKYFYERKDGQFDGLLNFGQKTPSFRPGDYRIKQGRKKYRTIDNETLAKEWLAFIGHSDETLRGGLKLFDNDSLYRRAFLMHPNNNYWSQLKKTIGSCPPVQDNSTFEEGSPSIAQYLLTHTIANFVKQRRVSFKKNRSKAIERLAKRGIIKTDNAGNPIEDLHAVDSKLYKDDKYFLGIVINNMQDIIIELYAMILVMKYGSLEDQTCLKLLKHPPIKLLVNEPYSDIDDSKADTKHILIPIYKFIKFSMDLFILKYGELIKAKPRLKSYLAQRDTVDMIRGFLIEVNEDKVPKWVDDWCPGKGTFISELPNIQ